MKTRSGGKFEQYPAPEQSASSDENRADVKRLALDETEIKLLNVAGFSEDALEIISFEEKIEILKAVLESNNADFNKDQLNNERNVRIVRSSAVNCDLNYDLESCVPSVSLPVENIVDSGAIIPNNPEITESTMLNSLSSTNNIVHPSEANKTKSPLFKSKIKSKASLDQLPSLNHEQQQQSKSMSLWAFLCLKKDQINTDQYTEVIKLVFDIYFHQLRREQNALKGPIKSWGKPVLPGPHIEGCLLAVKTKKLKLNISSDEQLKKDTDIKDDDNDFDLNSKQDYLTKRNYGLKKPLAVVENSLENEEIFNRKLHIKDSSVETTLKKRRLEKNNSEGFSLKLSDIVPQLKQPDGCNQVDSKISYRWSDDESPLSNISDDVERLAGIDVKLNHDKDKDSSSEDVLICSSNEDNILGPDYEAMPVKCDEKMTAVILDAETDDIHESTEIRLSQSTSSLSCSQSSNSLLDVNGDIYSTQITAHRKNLRSSKVKIVHTALYTADNEFQKLKNKKFTEHFKMKETNLKKEPDKLGRDSVSFHNNTSEQVNKEQLIVSGKRKYHEMQVVCEDSGDKLSWSSHEHENSTNCLMDSVEKKNQKKKKKSFEIIGASSEPESSKFEIIEYRRKMKKMCPICWKKFDDKDIEGHASTCGDAKQTDSNLKQCSACHIEMTDSIIREHESKCLREKIAKPSRLTRSLKAGTSSKKQAIEEILLVSDEEDFGELIVESDH